MCEVDEHTRQVSPDLLAIPEIRKAIELTEEAAYTPSELDAYDAYWNNVSTARTLWNGRYKEGLQEGLQAGLQKGKVETIELIARNMLKQKLSIDTISTVTGLSITTIQVLNEDNL
ncbi:hypothetical protein BH10PSE19_BH10PSE19_07210 [soil metagenome]